MAALKGILDNDRTQISRLAHRIIDTVLKTYQTEAHTVLSKDGSGYIVVTRLRTGETIRLSWDAEETITKTLDLTPGELNPALEHTPR
jgi:hypothetical protein